MKTKIIPFDTKMVKDIQDGKIEGKIKTRSGFPARIICYDADGYGVKMLIVLVRREEPKESCAWYYKNGKLLPEPESRLPHRDDLVLEVPDNESQEESKQNFDTVAESDAYAEGYKNGFRAGRCVAFDGNKGMTLKNNEPQFKPFDKVLVRETDGQVWHCDFYSYTDRIHGVHYCVGHCGEQILPYEANEHLVGTTDKPKEE